MAGEMIGQVVSLMMPVYKKLTSIDTVVHPANAHVCSLSVTLFDRAVGNACFTWSNKPRVHTVSKHGAQFGSFVSMLDNAPSSASVAENMTAGIREERRQTESLNGRGKELNSGVDFGEVKADLRKMISLSLEYVRLLKHSFVYTSCIYKKY